jgi:Flp pilus assembly protein TadG
MRSGRALWRDERGSALLEGAFVLPVLLVLLFGVYDFSWYFYQQHLLTTGVRDAARYLARSADPCEGSSPVWAAEVTRAANLATTGAVTGGAPRVSGWTPQMLSVECTPVENQPGADGLRPHRGDAVIYVVTVSTRFVDPSLGFFHILGLAAPVMAVYHAERVVGPG